MLRLVDSKQMKAIDSYTINSLKIPSLVLMERAAYATACVIAEDLGRQVCGAEAGAVRDADARSVCGAGAAAAPPKKVIAVCGSGNNGGDGLAIARILHTMGFETSFFMAGDLKKATPETLRQLEILENMGIGDCGGIQAFAEADALVDAVFGIGLMRPVGGTFAKVIEAMNAASCPVYAVDIPSGISTDTGQVLGCAVRAAKTVTFGCQKLGLVLYPGAGYAGQVVTADIGFPELSVRQADIRTFAWERSDIPGNLPPRHAYSNKGTYGRVLVIAGSRHMGGAAYFCARAAYGTGCGLVRVLTVADNRTMMLSALPEAVLSTYDSASPDWGMFSEALAWADSVVLGPGLTTQPYACEIVRYVMENCEAPLVIDADGLNILAKQPELWKLRERRPSGEAPASTVQPAENVSGHGRVPALSANAPAPVVITPHLGEMSRLTGKSIPDIAGNLLDICRDFAAAHGIVCVLKDARTAISDGTTAYINLSGNDGMATGGSGDVLSGIIGGFLASGMNALKAASFGCFVHGCAGDIARNEKGAYGLLASDIIQYMSKVIC